MSAPTRPLKRPTPHSCRAYGVIAVAAMSRSSRRASTSATDGRPTGDPKIRRMAAVHPHPRARLASIATGMPAPCTMPAKEAKATAAFDDSCNQRLRYGIIASTTAVATANQTTGNPRLMPWRDASGGRPPSAPMIARIVWAITKASVAEKSTSRMTCHRRVKSASTAKTAITPAVPPHHTAVTSQLTPLGGADRNLAIACSVCELALTATQQTKTASTERATRVASDPRRRV